MRIAEIISSIIDRLYIKRLEPVISPQLFRYGVCGISNMMLDTLWYYLIYHYVVALRFIDLGFVVVSPHIASLAVVFPITFFTGFWLNRYVAFRTTHISGWVQCTKYLLSVACSIVLNYVLMKLLVETVALWPTPSKVVTTVITALYSYLIGRYWVFRD